MKIDYLMKRISQMELKMELQACMVNVASRVSEELHSQIESLNLKHTDKLVLKGLPVKYNEDKELLETNIKDSLSKIEEAKEVLPSITDVHHIGKKYISKDGYHYTARTPKGW